MGPHESFELNGEFLQAGGNFTTSFIYLGESNQVYHSGSFYHKNRFVILDLEPRRSQKAEAPLLREPQFEEDNMTVVVETLEQHQKHEHKILVNSVPVKPEGRDLATSVDDSVIQKKPESSNCCSSTLKKVFRFNSQTDSFLFFWLLFEKFRPDCRQIEAKVRRGSSFKLDVFTIYQRYDQCSKPRRAYSMVNREPLECRIIQ
jgi:hypothetical protein